MNIFDIKNILFTFLNYPVSYIECIAACTSLITVWLAARVNIFTWPIGLINIALVFILDYQLHLYADMLLEIFYAIISIQGWLTWQQQQHHLDITFQLQKNKRYKLVLGILLVTLFLGLANSNIHL